MSTEQASWRERQQARAARSEEKLLRLQAKRLGLELTEDRVSAQGQGGPLAGATATVETSGDIERRITATRLVLTGPFALAMRKKRDHRTLYLTVQGEGFGFVLPVDPKVETLARQIAVRINAAGGGQVL